MRRRGTAVMVAFTEEVLVQEESSASPVLHQQRGLVLGVACRAVDAVQGVGGGVEPDVQAANVANVDFSEPVSYYQLLGTKLHSLSPYTIDRGASSLSMPAPGSNWSLWWLWKAHTGQQHRRHAVRRSPRPSPLQQQRPLQRR